MNRLPQESWTQTELRDAMPDDALVARPGAETKFGPWALINYQLAQLVDAIRRVEYVTAIAGQLDPAPKPPEPTPRPGVKPAKVRPIRTAKQIEYMNSLRARGA